MRLIKRAREKYQEDGLISLVEASVKRLFHPEFGIQRALVDPGVLRGHFRMKVLKPINELYARDFNIDRKKYTPKGATKVADEDWDNLIILDACRPDCLRECLRIEGEFSTITSLGPTTGSFIRRNFENESHNDIVYVSTNPHISSILSNEVFYKVAPLWENHWNNELNVVPPEVVVEQTLKLAEQHPNKKYIIHFTQPHVPFIGPNGSKLMKKHDLQKINEQGEKKRLYPRMRYGLLDISDEELKELYKENIEYVMPHVEELINKLDGKTVITSDHGELLGDTVGLLPMKGYGHPSVFHVDELLTVPWVELPFDDRRDTEEGVRNNQKVTDDDVVESRLTALGYK